MKTSGCSRGKPFLVQFEHLARWTSGTHCSPEQPPEVTALDAKLKSTVDAPFGHVTEFDGAAKLALMLEQIAAASAVSSPSPVLLDVALSQHRGCRFHVPAERERVADDS